MKQLNTLVAIVLTISVFSQQNKSTILDTETEFASLLNEYRNDNNLLTFDNCIFLQKTAEIQSNYLAINSLPISHTNSTPGLNSLFDRFMSTKPDYVPLSLGECIGISFDFWVS